MNLIIFFSCSLVKCFPNLPGRSIRVEIIEKKIAGVDYDICMQILQPLWDRYIFKIICVYIILTLLYHCK